MGLFSAHPLQAVRLAGASPTPAITPVPAPPLRGLPPGTTRSAEYRPYRMKGVHTPATPNSTSYDRRYRMPVSMGGGNQAGEAATDTSTLLGSCMDTADDKQVIDIPPRVAERDFAGTPYVPVYVMLPLGVINMKCDLVDPDGLMKQLKILKSINVDGVMVDCWWGIVEAHSPQEYHWHGYKRLFQIVRDLKLKLQFVVCVLGLICCR